MSIDEMKRIELEIMDEIHRICTEQGITYFLFYGSLLGAKRHGGFIPWDDDIDIVMMRDEYERFLDCFDQAKASGRFGLAFYRNGITPYSFAKVVDTKTKVNERYARKEFCSGVWVDVFPLDYYDPDNSASKKRIDRYSLLRTLIMARTDTGSTALIRLGKKLVCPFMRKIDPMKYCRLLDESSKVFAPESIGIVSTVIISSWKEAFPAEMFACNPVPIVFEDREYLTVADQDLALEIMYGDWQTPPPQNERETHSVAAYFL